MWHYINSQLILSYQMRLEIISEIISTFLERNNFFLQLTFKSFNTSIKWNYLFILKLSTFLLLFWFNVFIMIQYYKTIQTNKKHCLQFNFWYFAFLFWKLNFRNKNSKNNRFLKILNNFFVKSSKFTLTTILQIFLFFFWNYHCFF